MARSSESASFLELECHGVSVCPGAAGVGSFAEIFSTKRAFKSNVRRVKRKTREGRVASLTFRVQNTFANSIFGDQIKQINLNRPKPKCKFLLKCSLVEYLKRIARRIEMLSFFLLKNSKNDDYKII